MSMNTKITDVIQRIAQEVKKLYSTASQSVAGLMSAADKKKLDGIATGAQVNSIIGIKGNAESSYRTGQVNITPANIGLGNVNNTADANKSVASAVTCTGNAATATQLATARKLKVALNSTTDVTFDGSKDQTSIPVSGTLPVDKGGTGQTSIANIQAGKDSAGNTITSTYATKTDLENLLKGLVEIAPNGLPTTGTEGKLYLVPISGQTNTYTKHTWENNTWVALGSTVLDLTNYVTKPNAISALTISGKTLTYTKADGNTGDITTQDTTYSVADKKGLALNGTVFAIEALPNQPTPISYPSLTYTCRSSVAPGTEAGQLYKGSSGDFKLWSVPESGVPFFESGAAHIQNLRLAWGETYWHDIYTSPLVDGLWHRNVKSNTAYSWRRIVEENVDDVYAPYWKINISGSANKATQDGNGNTITSTYMIKNPSAIELKGTSTNGGLIDFHWQGDMTQDYTSRILETQEGMLYVNGVYISRTNGISGYVKTSDTIAITHGGTGATQITGNTGAVHALFPTNLADTDTSNLYFATLTSNFEQTGYLVWSTFLTKLLRSNLFMPRSNSYVSTVVKGTLPNATTWLSSYCAMESGGSTYTNRLTELRSFVDTTGTIGYELIAYDYNANTANSGAVLGIYHQLDGTKYATAPTPTTTDNSIKIATTAFVQSNIQTDLTNVINSMYEMTNSVNKLINFLAGYYKVSLS